MLSKENIFNFIQLNNSPCWNLQLKTGFAFSNIANYQCAELKADSSDEEKVKASVKFLETVLQAFETTPGAHFAISVKNNPKSNGSAVLYYEFVLQPQNSAQQQPVQGLAGFANLPYNPQEYMPLSQVEKHINDMEQRILQKVKYEYDMKRLEDERQELKEFEKELKQKEKEIQDGFKPKLKLIEGAAIKGLGMLFGGESPAAALGETETVLENTPEQDADNAALTDLLEFAQHTAPTPQAKRQMLEFLKKTIANQKPN